MLVGRAAELKYLNDYYKRDESHILVVYGQKYIGKTAIVREFVKDKPCHYYMARACSGKEHRSALEQLIQKVENDVSGRKLVVVIDEFQNAVRNSEGFMEELLAMQERVEPEQTMLTVLVSSGIGWVENRMVSVLGQLMEYPMYLR